jgi:hypothetical protein
VAPLAADCKVNSFVTPEFKISFLQDSSKNNSNIVLAVAGSLLIEKVLFFMIVYFDCYLVM